ncbi:hypothetical protein Tco_0422929 [Tanacetum coccineum]
MASSITRCDVALETLPTDMEAGEKATLIKKAYSTLILCLGDRILREVTKKTNAALIWMKLTKLYMTKSLANRLYLKKKLYTYYMSTCTKLGDHIDEFNKLILNLANIEIEIEDEDHALMLLTSLPSSYENFVDTLLYEGILDNGGCSDDFEFKGGNVYFGEALVVVGNDEMTELVMDSDESYHMTHSRDFLYDFKGFDGGSVQLGDNRTCTIKGTEKVKIQLHDGSSCVLKDVRYVLGLRRSLISLGILKKEGYTMKMQMGISRHGDSKQVGFKQLGVKQVEFKQLGPGVKTGVRGVHVDKHVCFEGELQGAQRNHEAEVFQVSKDDAAMAQRRLEDKQLEEKTNTNCLIKEQKKVHLGIKVGANIMVTGVRSQEGAEGNVTEKKKVKESKKANLWKLLKYNAWSTRWSLIRDSSTRKRC